MASQSDEWVPVERKKKPAPRAPILPDNRPGGGPSYNCTLCCVHCTSAADLRSHLSGKKHAEAVDQSRLSGKKHAGAAKRSGGAVADDTFRSWPCATCKLAFESALALTLHNLSKGHITRAHAWLENATLPQKIGSQLWHCHVCDVVTTSAKNLEMHVRGTKHAAKLAELEAAEMEPWPEETVQLSLQNGKLERPRPPAAFPDAQEEQSPAATPDRTPARNPDQEFLDELLGNSAGPSNWGGAPTQQPATNKVANGRPGSGSDTGTSEHAATHSGDMSAEEIIRNIGLFFQCSLTHEEVKDPVVASDGYTYEREAIETWVQHNRFSPVSKRPLPDRRVIPNRLVKQVVTTFQRSGHPPGEL